MAFDMGFDFRQTAGYVTDNGNWGVPQLDEIYPHTYTNGDGQSINAGWTIQCDGFGNDSNTVDARIAGRCNSSALQAPNFKIDLSSGSAPGAGTYTMDLAIGRATSTTTAIFQVKDDTSVVLQVAAPGTSLGVNHFLDATLTDVTGSGTWAGTPITQAFSSTTVNVVLNQSVDTFNVSLAHFRLTLQAGGAPYTLTADAGIIDLTGQALGLRAARRLIADVGALTLGGQAAALRADRRLTAAAGSLTLGGQSIALLADRRLSLDAGLLTLTGEELALLAHRALQLDRGLIVLTGQDATFTVAAPAAYQFLLESGLLEVLGQRLNLIPSAAGGYRARRDTTQPFRRHWT
jgi:hypothetical protein